MSEQGTKFGTMLNCMDGRTQEPVAKWMKEQFSLDVVDAPNPAGPTNMITKGDDTIVEHYKTETLISINGHNSRNVAIAAHQGCAKNPISDEEQIAELKKSCELVATTWGLPEGVRISGLWLTKNDDLDWTVNHLVDKNVEA